MARPRARIPLKEAKALEQAVIGRVAAEAAFERACRDAINAGASYREVAKAAGIALSTLQKIVPPRKDRDT